MIIPVRCFTCGKVIGDKWRSYDKKISDIPPSDEHSPEAARVRSEEMDRLKIVRYCCRRHFLGHVDLMEKI